MLAGALKDNRRAAIAGEDTFGKGLIQVRDSRIGLVYAETRQQGCGAACSAAAAAAATAQLHACPQHEVPNSLVELSDG